MLIANNAFNRLVSNDMRRVANAAIFLETLGSNTRASKQAVLW